MRRSSLRLLNPLVGGPRTTAHAAIRHHQALQYRRSSSLPIIAQPSFWASLVPKPFRKTAKSEGGVAPKEKSKEWNPATFFIVIFILIGSMSINMITLKNDFAAFTRRSDVRIGLLREVIERIQRGEKFDVEKALGTGDAEREQEWEDLLKTLEKQDPNRLRKSPEVATPNDSKAADGKRALDTPAGEVQTRQTQPLGTSGFY